MSLRGNTYVNKGKNRFCYIASLYTQHIVHHFIQIEGNPDFHVVLLSFCGNFRFEKRVRFNVSYCTFVRWDGENCFCALMSYCSWYLRHYFRLVAFLNQFGRLFSKQVHLNISSKKRVSQCWGISVADNGIHVLNWRVRIRDREEGHAHRWHIMITLFDTGVDLTLTLLPIVPLRQGVCRQ